MGVNHSRFYVLMSKQVLHLSDIDPVHEQMRCKRVPESMHCSVLYNACLLHRVFDCCLNCSVADVMAADNAGPWVNRKNRRREDILPAPLFCSSRIFTLNRQFRPALGPYGGIKIAKLFIKDIAEQKEKRIKRLVLGRGRNILLKCKM